MYEINVLPFSLLGFGFLLGIKHAFDADHVLAVSTIVSRRKSVKSSSLIGMFWGVGHLVSLFAAGLLVLLLKIQIPQKVSLFLEFIVGSMLILLGINVMLTIKKIRYTSTGIATGKQSMRIFIPMNRQKSIRMSIILLANLHW